MNSTTAPAQTPAQWRERFSQYRASCIRWLATMQSPNLPLGHFRYSRNAYHAWSLYGSHQALSCYRLLGLVDQLTDDERQVWADLFLRHYDADLELFICPQWHGPRYTDDPNDRDARRRADAAAPYKKLATSVQLLTGQLPPSRRNAADGFASLADLEAYFEQARKTMSAYSFGSIIGEFAQRRGFMLARRNESAVDDPWIRFVYDYIERVRDRRTGLLLGRDDSLIDGMNGLFKLSCSTFWRDNVRDPHARRIIDTLLNLADAQQGFGPDCADYNATMMLARHCQREQGYRLSRVIDVLLRTIPPRLEQRRQGDGGFSFHPHGCITQINHIKMADRRPESDLIGTAQQVMVMNELETLLGMTSPTNT